MLRLTLGQLPKGAPLSTKMATLCACVCRFPIILLLSDVIIALGQRKILCLLPLVTRMDCSKNNPSSNLENFLIIFGPRQTRLRNCSKIWIREKRFSKRLSITGRGRRRGRNHLNLEIIFPSGNEQKDNILQSHSLSLSFSFGSTFWNRNQEVMEATRNTAIMASAHTHTRSSNQWTCRLTLCEKVHSSAAHTHTHTACMCVVHVVQFSLLGIEDFFPTTLWTSSRRRNPQKKTATAGASRKFPTTPLGHWKSGAPASVAPPLLCEVHHHHHQKKFNKSRKST